MRFILFSLLVILSAEGTAQKEMPPFWSDIQAFKKQDSINMPAKQQILFVGSSSFTNWKDVQSYFPSYPIINRGFGGSLLTDLIRYADEIIFPYQPRQIVIYCGENDLAAADSVTGAMVFRRFEQLFEMIRSKSPAVPVAFISLKPSPSRWNLKDKMIDANNMIESFLKEKKTSVFIDVYHQMLDTDSKPIRNIFLEDNLHINAKGYAIWRKLIEPHLLKK